MKITDNRESLLRKLKEMFQFDQANLDFGIYRIMNMKRREIDAFLNDTLPGHISEELCKLISTYDTEEIKKLEKAILNNREFGVSTAELEKKLSEKKSATIDIDEFESDIYSHLSEFFSRYYDDGDFISERCYNNGTYAIPYDGEEVKLHWANADQYYVKTSQYFKEYSFKLGEATVAFKIVDAETEKDNNKAKEERYFQLNPEKNYEFEGNALTIYLVYKTGEKKQTDFNKEIIEAVKEDCAKNHIFSPLLEQGDKGKTELELQLARYTAKNTFDYFIHKDLKVFLERELDFYVKTEVLFIDDLDAQLQRKSWAYIVKTQIIKLIGHKIIAFLAQIENFQKKLYLKKKFIVEANYCITLDRVPESFYSEIAGNERQCGEWLKLFGIAAPLTIAFLKENPFLVLDTVFFGEDFKERLIGQIDNLDDNLDGLLIHSENFQALNLLQERYRGDIDCIHIDPPYNTDTSGFLYKNNYRHSSWLSMMNDRIALSYSLLNAQGSFVCHIDENEYERLWLIFEGKVFNTAGTVIWDKRNPMTGGSGIATQHEYIIWRSKGEITINLNTNNANIILEKAKELINKNGNIDDTVRREFSAWINANSDLSGGEKAYRFIDNNGSVYRAVSLRAPEYRENEKFHIPLIHPVTGKPCPVPPNGFSRTPETLATMIDKGEILFGTDETTQPNQKRVLTANSVRQLTSVIQDATRGKIDTDKLGIFFPYNHSVSFYDTLVSLATDEYSLVLDYFAGSGTTAHAVINLNRADGGRRRWILCEMGEYFDTVTKPRIQKVIYSDDWKDGKPIGRKGISHAFKYIRLESYEDTLNNIEFGNTAFGNTAFFAEQIKEEHFLKYMLDRESVNSQCFLSAGEIKKPFNYKLSIIRKNESKPVIIDLVETFNYLIGLKICKNHAKQEFCAEIKKDEQHKALIVTLKEGKDYTLKAIEGTLPDGSNVLVLWRTLSSDLEKDNAVLDEYFKRFTNRYKKIYVNGDCNISDTLLIEDEMKIRLFNEA